MCYDLERVLLCRLYTVVLFVFGQETAYDRRISDWSSEVCSSDLQWRLWSMPGTSAGAATGTTSSSPAPMRPASSAASPATAKTAAPASATRCWGSWKSDV